jgi:hypothetical protein
MGSGTQVFKGGWAPGVTVVRAVVKGYICCQESRTRRLAPVLARPCCHREMEPTVPPFLSCAVTCLYTYYPRLNTRVCSLASNYQAPFLGSLLCCSQTGKARPQVSREQWSLGWSQGPNQGRCPSWGC